MSCRIPRTVGVAIPLKATFFITYIMVDGWAGIAAEVLRLFPLVLFHIKNAFIVKTEKDKEEAMDAGGITFYITEPRIQLYFLLGLVYAPVTPFILPFIVVFFAFSYLVFRHQVRRTFHSEFNLESCNLPKSYYVFGFFHADHQCIRSKVRECSFILARCSSSCNCRLDNLTTPSDGTAQHKKCRQINSDFTCSSCPNHLVLSFLQGTF